MENQALTPQWLSGKPQRSCNTADALLAAALERQCLLVAGVGGGLSKEGENPDPGVALRKGVSMPLLGGRKAASLSLFRSRWAIKSKAHGQPPCPTRLLDTLCDLEGVTHPLRAY